MTRRIAIVALVVALGAGAGMAVASRVTKSTVESKVAKLEKLNRSALASARAAKKVVAKPSPIGPIGPRGARGPEGALGAKGPQGESGAAAYGRTIPSGRTVTGAWGGRFTSPGEGVPVVLTISLPARAPAALGDGDVLFGAGSPGASDVDQTRCPGSFQNPQAASGTACLYLESTQAATAGVAGIAFAPAPDRGFAVRMIASQSARVGGRGTWAYRAP